MARRTLGKVEAATDEDEVTRCICGNQVFVSTNRTRALNAQPGLYVQCERCNVWQHGFCMGFESETEVPNDYYCEKCEPQFHRVGHRHGILQSRYRPHSEPKEAKQVKKEKIKDKAKDLGKEKVGNESQVADTAKNSDSPSTPVENTAEKVAEKPETDDHPANITDAEPNPSEPEYQPSSVVKPDPDGPDSGPKVSLESEKGKGSEDTGSEPEELSETKKRVRRRESDELGFRNRKRRSREDIILQRVLEQSAKEAREAEERRKQDSAGSADVSINTPEVEESPKRPSRVRNARTTQRKKPAPKISEYSKRNGGRRCKPRVPSQKSTLPEMRRRVAAILEFSSRTQSELEHERSTSLQSLRVTPGAESFRSELKHINGLCSKNMAGLEHIAERLLQWEDKYGIESP